MIQTTRGAESFPTKSVSEEDPLAPSAPDVLIASGFRS